MKTQRLLLMTTLCLMAASHALGAEDRQDLAVTIIIDTRWSCANDMPEFRTLARQAIGGLQSRDMVEILTAHSNRPRIRIAQTLRNNALRQMDTVNRILSNIHSNFLSDAQVSRALAMALDRLQGTCSTQGHQKAVVIILTDGHLTNADVAGVLELASEFRKHNWPLYITGDRNTNRNLLIASNKGKVNWSSIGDANPTLWLQQARTSLQLGSEDESTQEQPQEAQTAPSEAMMEKPLTLGESPLHTPLGPSYLNSEWRESSSATSESRRAQDITTRSRTEVEVTISDGSTPIPADEAAETSPPKELPVVPTAAEEPNQVSEAVEPDKTLQEQTPSPPKQPMGARIKHWLSRFWLWLLAGIVALLVGVAAYLVARDSRKAGQIRKRVHAYLRTKRSAHDGMVVATINGQTRHLGRLSRLRPFYIGSGAKNTLRIAQKGISDRHLCLYQKAGRLMAQNLSRNPVMIAGTPLAPKGKRGVGLPAVIELARDIKLRLAIAQPKPSGAERRKEHGQTNEIQEAASAVSR